ncbi:hypothetical protein [Streptomyces sp. NPDC001070]
MDHIIGLLATNLAERFEQGVARIGDNLYVRFPDDPRVLKVVLSTQAVGELRVQLVAVDPERGPIDAVSVVHTRPQKLSDLLEPLDAFLGVWFA